MYTPYTYFENSTSQNSTSHRVSIVRMNDRVAQNREIVLIEDREIHIKQYVQGCLRFCVFVCVEWKRGSERER